MFSHMGSCVFICTILVWDSSLACLQCGGYDVTVWEDEGA